MSASEQRNAATLPHPPYLDDEGGGERCFLLYHLAATRGEAEKIIDHMGFEWDWRAAEVDVVWLAPVAEDEDYYDPATPGTPNAARYWRFRW